MQLLLSTENSVYRIEVKKPTKQELDNITQPDFEGQTSPKQVYVDRQLQELARALTQTGYRYDCYE